MKKVRLISFSGRTAGGAFAAAATGVGGRTMRSDMIFAESSETSAAGAPASAPRAGSASARSALVAAIAVRDLGERAVGEERARIREPVEVWIGGAQQVDVVAGGVALGLDQAALRDALVGEDEQLGVVGRMLSMRAASMSARIVAIWVAVDVEVHGALQPAVRVVEPVFADRLLHVALQQDRERGDRARARPGRRDRGCAREIR